MKKNNQIRAEIIRSLICLFCMFMPAFVYAGTYECSGPVKGVTIQPTDGQLLPEEVAGIFWPRLCSVATEENSISPEVCKSIYSLLLTAQTTGKTVTLWFNDGLDCSEASHPQWQFLTGWYFGPHLDDN